MNGVGTTIWYLIAGIFQTLNHLEQNINQQNGNISSCFIIFQKKKLSTVEMFKPSSPEPEKESIVFKIL